MTRLINEETGFFYFLLVYLSNGQIVLSTIYLRVITLFQLNVIVFSVTSYFVCGFKGCY